MQEEKFYLLAAKYLAGEASSEEQLALEDIVAKDHVYASSLKQLQASWHQESSTYTLFSLEKGQRILNRKFREVEGVDIATYARNRERKASNAFTFKIAASILLLLISGLTCYRIMRYQGHESLPEVVYHEVSTGPGEKMTLSLSDGSKIVLNHLSRLRYPSDFGTIRREVELEGEAFFEVARDTTRPFLVHTEDIRTTVLGTSFNIRSFQNSEHVAVTVSTGKVEVLVPAIQDRHKRTFVLLPDNQLTIEKSGPQIKTDLVRVDVQEYTGWTTGKLQFVHMQFGEVAKTLQRVYAVEIVFQNKAIEAMEFTASFEPMPLSRLLDLLKKIHHFDYEIHGKKVLITSKV